MAQLADAPIPQPIAHLLEARQRATVVRHKQVQAGALKRALHQRALLGIHRHGFLDTAMLAGCRHHQAVFKVAGGWRGDVHRIHFRVIDQRLGVGIEAGNAMACGIIAYRFFTTAHDSHQGRTWYFVESGTTLQLCDTATTDHAPTDGAHLFPLCVFIKGAVSTSPEAHATSAKHDNHSAQKHNARGPYASSVGAPRASIRKQNLVMK